jgi:hypothetical protein
VFLQIRRGSYSRGSWSRSFIYCEAAHREQRRRERSRQVSAVFLIFVFLFILLLTIGFSVTLQLASKPEIIAALRAA